MFIYPNIHYANPLSLNLISRKFGVQSTKQLTDDCDIKAFAVPRLPQIHYSYCVMALLEATPYI